MFIGFYHDILVNKYNCTNLVTGYVRIQIAVTMIGSQVQSTDYSSYLMLKRLFFKTMSAKYLGMGVEDVGVVGGGGGGLGEQGKIWLIVYIRV